MVTLVLLAFVGTAYQADAHSERYLKAAMVVDHPVASPGDLVMFRISVESTDDDPQIVSVATELSDGLILVGAGVPSSCEQETLTWLCRVDGSGPLLLTLQTRVQEGTEGKELVGSAWISLRDSADDDEDDDDEKEDAGGEAIKLQAGVKVVPTSLKPAPRIEVVLNVAQDVAIPGEELNYRIDVMNNGSAPARDVSVRASIPSAATLVSANPTPAVRTGELEWWADSLPVGSTAFLFNLTIPPSSDLTEVNTAVTVIYGSDRDGGVRVQNAGVSLGVTSVPMVLPPLGRDVPLGIVAGLTVAIAFGLVVAQRTLAFPVRSPPPVEEVFLLHRSGVVLQHFSARRWRTPDADIVGGMLAAIQLFVQDSVDHDAGPLREIRFGGRTILYVSARYAVVAALSNDGGTRRFAERARSFLIELEAQHGPALENFNGMAAALDGVDAAFRAFTRSLSSSEN